MTNLNPKALEALKWNQRQLDVDGVEVGVSRQALDELIAAYDVLQSAPGVVDIAKASESIAEMVADWYGNAPLPNARITASVIAQRLSRFPISATSAGVTEEQTPRIRPLPPMGEEAETYRKERGPQWTAIFDALRDYTMSNMCWEDGLTGYPLVDRLSREGDGVTIADGEWEMVNIADEIMSALEASRVAPVSQKESEELWALCYLHDWDPPREGQEHRWEPGKNIFPAVHAFYTSWQDAEAIRKDMTNPAKYWVVRARTEDEARMNKARASSPVSAPAVEPVGIKALEWDGDDYVRDGERQAYFNATGADYSRYHIVLDDELWKLTRLPSERHAYEDMLGRFGNSDAAKAAAQADYEARIRSTLIPTTSPAKGAATGTETAWLIELRNDRPVWWTLALDEEPGWVTDPDKALRFARKVDADCYIEDEGWTDAFAIEHSWPALRSSSPVDQETAKEGGE